MHSQSSDNQSQRRKDEQNTVQPHPFHEPLQDLVELVQQTRRESGFTQGEKDDGPVERVKVFLARVS
jgi:hypothetical protein